MSLCPVIINFSPNFLTVQYVPYCIHVTVSNVVLSVVLSYAKSLDGGLPLCQTSFSQQA